MLDADGGAAAAAAADAAKAAGAEAAAGQERQATTPRSACCVHRQWQPRLQPKWHSDRMRESILLRTAFCKRTLADQCFITVWLVTLSSASEDKTNCGCLSHCHQCLRRAGKAARKRGRGDSAGSGGGRQRSMPRGRSEPVVRTVAQPYGGIMVQVQLSSCLLCSKLPVEAAGLRPAAISAQGPLRDCAAHGCSALPLHHGSDAAHALFTWR